MNILVDRLPTKVHISGEDYSADTDFRTALSIILAFEDMDLTREEKCMIMLDLFYIDHPKEDIKGAIDMAIKFLNCGESDSDSVGGNPAPPRRLYSFEKDAKYIYSAIKQSHGVDLEAVDYLHWWKFCYMFADLREDCFFHKMIYLRKQKQIGKLSKEEAQAYAQMKDVLDLPKQYTTEELEEMEEVKRILGIEVI